MFLTRLGFGSKMVVTGDVTQVDLPDGTVSGLRQVRQILDGVEDIHFTELTSADVVRHRLVTAIVDAYERSDATRRDRRDGMRDGREHRRSRREEPGRARRERRGPQRDRVPRQRHGAGSPLAIHHEMKVHPQADLCARLVDEPRDGDPPRAVDGHPAVRRHELPDGRAAPGREDRNPEVLGDIVLCPTVAANQAKEAGHATDEELLLLDARTSSTCSASTTPDSDEREMFELQRQPPPDLSRRPRPPVRQLRRGTSCSPRWCCSPW